MSWVDLRQEIGNMFAELSPTQWTALFSGWMFKPFVFWDDKGERRMPQTVSDTYAWRRGKERVQDSREAQARHRKINRYSSMRKRTNCAGCGRKLDHSQHQNVRKYCTPECQSLFLRKRKRAIEREKEARHCEICSGLFFVEKYMNKKTCSDTCRKERNRRRRRKKSA